MREGEILVLAYSFSSKPIADALVEAKTRGVQVEIILDRSNEQETYSDLHLFHEQGLAPLIDAHHAIAHNKVMIIDQRTLITGSFNFTHQAEGENAENLFSGERPSRVDPFVPARLPSPQVAQSSPEP